MGGGPGLTPRPSRLSGASENNNDHGLRDDRIYTDMISGKNMRRPAWTQLREMLQPGDMVVVPRIDRLAGNHALGIRTVQYLHDQGRGGERKRSWTKCTSQPGAGDPTAALRRRWSKPGVGDVVLVELVAMWAGPQRDLGGHGIGHPYLAAYASI